MNRERSLDTKTRTDAEKRKSALGGFAQKNRDQLRQFATFVVIGAINTAFYVTLYNSLRVAGVGPFVANGIAVMISITFSFWANSRFTFKMHDAPGSRRRYLEFAGVFLSTLVLSNGALWVLFRVVGRPTAVQESIVLVASGTALFVVRFAIMRAWVFNPNRSA